MGAEGSWWVSRVGIGARVGGLSLEFLEGFENSRGRVFGGSFVFRAFFWGGNSYGGFRVVDFELPGIVHATTDWRRRRARPGPSWAGAVHVGRRVTVVFFFGCVRLAFGI